MAIGGDILKKDVHYSKIISFRMSEKQNAVIEELGTILTARKGYRTDFSPLTLLRLSLAMAIKDPDAYMNLVEKTISDTHMFDINFDKEKRESVRKYFHELKKHTKPEELF